jgi:hypothetical protein
MSFLLRQLRVTLKVTADPITNHGKGKVFKNVTLLGSQSQESAGQVVVVLALLGSVVLAGILKVFFLVREEILFQLEEKGKERKQGSNC